MQDNVIETKSRIYKLLDALDALNVQYDINIVQPILDKNLVCSDFFLWNFEEWKPYKN